MPSFCKTTLSSLYAKLQVVKDFWFLLPCVFFKCSKNSVAHLQYFRTMDVANWKAHNRIVYLAAMFFYSNEKIFILSLSLVPKEDWVNRLWLLSKIAFYLTSLWHQKVVIIRNQVKKFSITISECFHPAIHRWCSQFLSHDWRQSYTKVIK